MGKKDVAIVLGSSCDMAFAIGTFLIDLKKHSPNLVDDVIIYHDGISKKDQKVMNQILPAKFIKYKLSFGNNMNPYVQNRFSDLVFYKYECLKLLEEYKTVIATDFDIVLLDDISEIAQKTNENITCKMLINNNGLYNYFDQNVIENNDFKYDMNITTMSAGLIVFYDSLKDFNNMYNYCIENTLKFSKYLLLPEQAIFSLMINDFNIKPEKIEREIWVVHPKDINERPKAKILHALGDDKFWDRLPNEQWNENYNTWLSMGGSANGSYKKYLKSKNTKINNHNRIINKICWFIPIRKLRESFRNKFLK